MGLIVIAALLCALQALRSPRLLVSALWLAGSSALIALMLYLMGAHEIAVVELSVGAGLVTILFVFAISVAGDEKMDVNSIVPRPLAITLVAALLLGIGWFALRQPELSVVGSSATGSPSFNDALWQQRGLDVLLQIVLIFGGVLGVIGLLADAKTARQHAAGGSIEELRSNGNGQAALTGVFPVPVKPEVQHPQQPSPVPAPEKEVAHP